MSVEETITVLTTSEREYLPCVYTMSGGAFEELVEAVKQLPRQEHEFKSTFDFKYWRTNEACVATLRERGYKLERQSDLFLVCLDQPMGARHQYNKAYLIQVSLNLRNRSGEPPGSNISGLSNTLYLYIRDDFLAERKEALAVSRREMGYSHPIRDDEVVESAVRETFAIYQKTMQARFQELRGDGSIDTIKNALHLIKDQVTQERELRSATFAALCIDAKTVIVEATHPLAQILIQQVNTQVEAQQQAEQAAREQAQRAKIERAPQQVNEWFHRLNKAEIADVVKSRAGREVNQKQKKEELIASIVADRPLCEQLIR